MEKKSLLISCPVCGSETETKVYDDTVLMKFPLYCPHCKKETLIDIAFLKMVPKNEHDEVEKEKTEMECC